MLLSKLTVIGRKINATSLLSTSYCRGQECVAGVSAEGCCKLWSITEEFKECYTFPKYHRGDKWTHSVMGHPHPHPVWSNTPEPSMAPW